MTFHRSASKALWLTLFYFSLLPLVHAEPQSKDLKENEIFFTADDGTRDIEEKKAELSGNVQIIFHNQHLSCDHATIYFAKKEFEATGHVNFVTPKASLGGEKVVMNYSTNIGSIYNGYIQSGPIFFDGNLIEKTGDDNYSAKEGSYTACTTCPSAWNFSGSSIDAEMGGYARINNMVLRVYDVPVLWLPFIVVPLKSARQSGLLTPSIEYSSNGGTALSQPLFWAISKSQDATFTLKPYAQRGIKGLANYRFILAEKSSGELNFGALSDRVFTNDTRLNKFHPQSSNFSRYFLNYSHYFALPHDWINRVQFRRMSDLQYATDFPEDMPVYGDSALESRVSLSKSFKDHYFGIDSSYYINLLQSDPLARNDDSVHRLPEVRLSQVAREMGDSGFLLNYELEYTNFARNTFAYDDLSSFAYNGKTKRMVKNNCPTKTDASWQDNPDCQKVRDGNFDAGTDLIRSGQRLTFTPTISRPIKIADFFDIKPSLSFKEAHYSFGVGQNTDLARRFLRTELSARTTFSRIYGNLEEVQSTRYKHEIQPELVVSALPWIDQPNHPFWGFDQKDDLPFFTRDSLSDDDFHGSNGLQFDFNDRLYDRKVLTYHIHNKVMRKSWSYGNAVYDQVALFRLSQTYDANLAARKSPDIAWSDMEIYADIHLNSFSTNTTLNYFPYQKVTNTAMRLNHTDEFGRFLQVQLTRRYAINPDLKEVDSSTRTEDWTFAAGTSSRYFNLVGMFTYDSNDNTAAAKGRRIKSWKTGFILKPPGNCWNIVGVFKRRFDDVLNKTLDSGSFNFAFLYNGKNTTQLSLSTIEGL